MSAVLTKLLFSAPTVWIRMVRDVCVDSGPDEVWLIRGTRHKAKRLPSNRALVYYRGEDYAVDEDDYEELE